MDILVLFLTLEKYFQLFSMEYISWRFVIYGIYYVQVDSLCAHFLESFYHKWVNFVKSFFYIYWDDHMVFILQFLDVVYHTDWFVDIEESLYP